MRSPRRLAPALGTALLAVAALAPSPASAASCTFDAAAAKVTVGYGAPGELARVGRSSAGAIQLDGAACGAATVTNTDLIQATGGQGVQRLVIDLAGGPLAPGKTAETGQASEIEIAVDAGTGGEFPLSDEVRVIGAAGADQLGFAGGGLLLNGDGDTDVTTTGAEALAAEGGGGNDRLLGAGATLPLVLDGGAGDDVLEGGDRDDTLEGGPGNDTETGNEGTDRFRQGSVADGRDTLDGGGSPYDEIDYSARTTAVRIDLDGVADDGAAGELDNLRDSFEYLTGGGGSDTIVASPTRYQPFEVHGNGGDDVLTGGANTDQLFGGDGQDTLDGLASTDSLAGGPGDDTEIGGDGSDVFLQADEPDGADDLQGGAGTDHYTARGRTADLTVKLDGVAGDGATGEGDNVRADVEHVTTGRGDDTVTGSAADNTFDGGPGGDDKLSGGDGKDLVSGWSENDTLDGGAGDDEVRGGDGSDRVSGGTGADGVFGDEGEDLLLEPPARDGADRLTGGGGRDRASYAFRGAGVTVTLDDLANDGAAGEGDDVRAETVTGSAAADRLTGSPAIDVLDGGRGDDRLEGLGDDDTLSGGTGADALVGGDGRDLADYRAHTAAITVTLAGGADDGAAGEGDDAQTEDVAGGSGSDRITGTSGANHLDGGRGNDILDGGLGADYLIGSTGTDTASYATRSTRVVLSIGEALDGMDRDGDGKAEEGDFVDTTVESLTGGAGADRLTGGSGAGVLSGNGGDDVLDGLYGADQLIGGTGRDTADYATRSEPVSVTLDAAADDGAEGERDRVSTTVEVVVGGHAGDRLTGGAGNELLRGARGDDVLAGGAGADDLFGGYGTDTVTYAERPAAEPVVVTLDNLANDGAFETERDNVRTDVESLVGGAGDDDLRADDGPNTLSGGPAGADRLYARGGDDRLDEGPNPPDSSADRDELFGGDGRDTADYSHRTEGLRLSLDGIPNDGVPAATGRGAESDNIHADVEDVVGGTGTDVITGDARANRLEGRGSNDRLEGGDGPDALYGGDSPDRLYGDKGDDHLHGEKSNNALYGGDGDDTLVESSSRAGNDLFEGGPGRDAVDYGRRQASLILDNDGEPGDDGLDADRDFDAEEADTIAEDIEIMRGGFAADRLTSRPYLDEGCTVLDGSGGADVLTGNASDDLLLGGHGDDQLWGEAGDDVLHGGPDNDEELGDSGADVFWQGGFGGGCGAPARAATEGPDGQDEIVAGSNDDTIHYHRSAGDIELTLNDQTPNDGAWNERDRVRDMENAHGGAGNDHIVGTSEDNELSGGPAGSDRLEGRGAGDRLISAFDPEGGGDTLLGEGGSDKFLTADGDGRDTLDGGLDRDYGEWDAGDAREDTP